jgi:hypothetical protein
MTRLILSILAGLFTCAILSSAVDHVFHTTGVYPPYGVAYFDTDLYLMAFAYRAVFAIFGSWLTAELAREQANKAVWIVGIIGSLLWLAGAIAMWEYGPAWYSIIGVVTGIPFALIGGKLHQIRTRTQAG